MKTTYDKDADAAYIYLKDKITKGDVKDTISMNENIILDFDSHKKLIGIEILSASKVVPKRALEKFNTPSFDQINEMMKIIREYKPLLRKLE